MDFERFKKTQTQVLKLLNNSYKKNRVSHVYLFEGAKGTLKLDGAYYLSNLLLCKGDNPPCGECLECRRIKRGSHPRIYLVEADGEVIRKDQIDNLIHEFSRKGLEEGNRIYIIKDIDKATPSAANTLLKFIEESVDGVYGILLTDNIGNVIPTILSRCQIVNFYKVNQEDLIKEYEKNNLSGEVSRILSIITNDTIEGLALVNEGKLNEIIDLVKLCNKAILDYKDAYVTFFENCKVLMDEGNVKKYHQIFLDLMITITNDRIYKSLGQDDRMIFDLDIDTIDIDYNEAVKQSEILVKYKERLKYNVNLETMYMEMFIEVGKK